MFLFNTPLSGPFRWQDEGALYGILTFIVVLRGVYRGWRFPKGSGTNDEKNVFHR